MRGDDEGGPWVAPLPRAGHACSCSRGKILLIILCPLYVRRAWCGVGSHAGETSHRNALCSLPRRLAQSGARVGPRGRRCYIANSRSAVWWRVWGLKPSAKPKKEKRKRWSIRGLRCPSSGSRAHEAVAKAARGGQLPHRPRHFGGRPHLLASRGVCPGPSWMRLPDRTGRVGSPVVLLSQSRVGSGLSSVRGGPLLSEMNVARHISTQAPVRCWWRSFFGTGWVAFLPLAFVLVLVVLVVLVAVLMALWIASPVGHLELLQRTPCTGHGAPGIFADERRAGDARIPASFLPDPPPSSTRPPEDRHP